MKGGAVTVLELKPGERGEVCEILPGGGEKRGGGKGLAYGHRHCHRHRHCQGRGRSRRGGEGKGCGERLLEVLGVYRGQVLEVMENRGCGPVVLKVGDSRFVLGRGQAARILVNRIGEEVKS
ncbi:FeoA family protein [Thermosulfurimonas dismutans]|uniref:Ferrous iron transport protein FeoA n=1 Tax=Thermosulfurimonas dismutans TaxID=999894 RepID=A0A179D1X4_9BACT|nr:FeoA family protein [Thermosulfurimonas dismutans]OAQ20064.1 Ferrous iron transport protein FeoA [Thermosulfurimonas dismutans]